ncbi:MAG: ABC transporter ATP-binding protein, partial [Trueperaceae bacterium]
ELAMAGRVPAGEALRHLAALRGGEGADRIAPLAERLTLDLDRPVRTLSKGNKQKVGVIQAFMHRPELLILDEPTSGLDPLLQHEVLALIREAAERGATVLMSSHVLHEVEEVASRVAIIREGRIVDTDDVAALRQRAGQRVTLRFSAPVDAEPFRALTSLNSVEVDGDTVVGVLHGEPHDLIQLAARHHVTFWQARDRDLEELFLDAYRNPERHA